MSNSIFKGVVHGKTIELEQEPGLPDGQAVTVEVRPMEEKRPAADTAGILRSKRGWAGWSSIGPSIPTSGS